MEFELFLKYEIHQVSVFLWQLALKIQTTSKFNQGQQEQLLYPFFLLLKITAIYVLILNDTTFLGNHTTGKITKIKKFKPQY